MSAILFVDQSGQLGGAELCLADIAAFYRDQGETLLLSSGPFEEYLQKQNLKVSLYTLPKSLSNITKETSLSQLLVRLPALASYFKGIRQKVRAFDLVYLNTAKALLLGVGASLFGRQRRVFHLHDILDNSHFSSINIALLVMAANRTHAVIANSQATADAFRKAGGKVPTYVVPNGFDPTTFAPVPEAEIIQLRNEFNPSFKTVAAIFGRLARWKGQHLLIEAAARLQNLTVWIIGEALFTEDDKAYADELRELARRSKADVHFLGFRRNVPALMQAADIIVNCSVAPEPFGRVIVEGMFSGKPVVAPRAGGPREIVEDKVTGLLFKPDNGSQLTEALRSLLQSESVAREMGAKGRLRATEKYSLSAIHAQIDAILAPLLQKR